MSSFYCLFSDRKQWRCRRYPHNFTPFHYFEKISSYGTYHLSVTWERMIGGMAQLADIRKPWSRWDR